MALRRFAVLFLFVAFGCGGSREAAWDTTPTHAATAGGEGGAESRQAQLAAEGDALWAERSDATKLRACIAKWEEALAADGASHELWTKLSRAYYFLADGHLRFEENSEAALLETFEKGTQAAERALVALSPDFAQRMRAGTRIEEAVGILGRDAVPALYWRSVNLGKWASTKGFATLLSYKDEVRAIMTRCLELDANYFYTGPHRYFGAFYARAPSFAGGDLEKSKEHFETSIRLSPNYFATRVLFAEDYARKAQSRQLFEEQLRSVVDGDANVDPEVAAENAVEQRKARELLERVDEFFE